MNSLLLLVGSLTAMSSEASSNHVKPEQESTNSSLLRGLIVSRRRRPKIIGGNNVRDPDRYPYFALLNGSSLCGAVLISKRFVLTAAHCVGADNDFQIGITETSSFVDSWFGNSDGGGTTEYAYKRGVIHPNYDDDSVSHDIALYELDRDVPDSLPYIRLEQTPVTVSETSMTVIGFGDTDPSERITDLSDFLLQATVDYVTRSACINRMGGAIGPDMLCAYEEGEDTCQGDSGGPLFLKGDSVAEDSLVGLVSWGYSCGGDTPGVYTRISYFYDWIVETMCLLNPDGVPEYVDCNIVANGNGGGGGGDKITVPPETLFPSNSETASTGFVDDYYDFDNDEEFSIAKVFQAVKEWFLGFF